MVNHKVQDALEKFQDTTNKGLEKTQKQLNECREATMGRGLGSSEKVR
jgi:hypothetical protein